MANELLADVFARNLETLKMIIADFSDADVFVRPCSKANHAAWQLGHLIAGETMMINSCTPGAMPELPAGFAEKFDRKNCGSDNPADFSSKPQLLELLGKTRAASIAWVRSLTPQDMSRPAPEQLRSFFPTVGNVAHLIPEHLAMHLGQLQVIRRKLGKPILF